MAGRPDDILFHSIPACLTATKFYFMDSNYSAVEGIFISTFVIAWLIYRFASSMQKFARDAFFRPASIAVDKIKNFDKDETSPHRHVHIMYQSIFYLMIFSFLYRIAYFVMWFLAIQQPDKYSLINGSDGIWYEKQRDLVVFIADLLRLEADGVLLASILFAIGWLLRANIKSQVTSFNSTPSLGQRVLYNMYIVFGLLSCIAFMIVAAFQSDVLPNYFVKYSDDNIRPLIIQSVWLSLVLMIFVGGFVVSNWIHKMYTSMNNKKFAILRDDKSYWCKKTFDRWRLFLMFVTANMALSTVELVMIYKRSHDSPQSFVSIFMAVLTKATLYGMPLAAAEAVICSLKWLGWHKSGSYSLKHDSRNRRQSASLNSESDQVPVVHIDSAETPMARSASISSTSLNRPTIKSRQPSSAATLQAYFPTELRRNATHFEPDIPTPLMPARSANNSSTSLMSGMEPASLSSPPKLSPSTPFSHNSIILERSVSAQNQHMPSVKIISRPQKELPPIQNQFSDPMPPTRKKAVRQSILEMQRSPMSIRPQSPVVANLIAKRNNSIRFEDDIQPYQM